MNKRKWRFVKAKDVEKKFDRGKNISRYLDLSKATRMKREQKPTKKRTGYLLLEDVRTMEKRRFGAGFWSVSDLEMKLVGQAGRFRG